MLSWMICPVMLKVIESEYIAIQFLWRSLGDYYIEAVEWMSLMGLDLGTNCGLSPRQKEYRVICSREHTQILSCSWTCGLWAQSQLLKIGR